MSTQNEKWIARQRIRSAIQSMGDEVHEAVQRARERGEHHRAYRMALLQRACGDIGHEWDDLVARDGQIYRRCRTCRLVDVSGVRMEDYDDD